MTILDRVQSRLPARPPNLSSVTTAQWLLLVIMAVAVFTRFWRLGTPDGCYFDEVYFPTTAAEILRGDRNAWQFFGHENTHPPLSKELMALGMALPLVGGNGATHGVGECWPDAEDSARKGNPDWLYEPAGWRFFGALAGVGAVFFMYLLARRLFQSEVAGLASAAFLTFDGLALAQSRIGTPDTYVLFFILGCLYFLVSDRFLLSGVFLGAAAASKWIGAFGLVPVVVYLVVRLIRGIQETERDVRLRTAESLMVAGGAFAVLAIAAAAAGSLVGDSYSDGAKAAAVPLLVAILAIAAGIIAILSEPELRRLPRSRVYVEMALVFPVFFLLVPLYVYLMTYIPMFVDGYSLGEAWNLNEAAYDFHSTLAAPHSYSSSWETWPIMGRPIYFFVEGTGDRIAKIYSLGNPALFWLGLPALGFVFLQAFSLRFKFFPRAGNARVNGALRFNHWPFLFVIIGYLGVWLPWSVNPRVLFIYHYLPALVFVILALGYVVHRLWYQKESWGRTAAICVVGLVAVTFLYFYPHWTALEVPTALDESYYWFDSWR